MVLELVDVNVRAGIGRSDSIGLYVALTVTLTRSPVSTLIFASPVVVAGGQLPSEVPPGPVS